jgi:hypothetical protein
MGDPISLTLLAISTVAQELRLQAPNVMQI